MTSPDLRPQVDVPVVHFEQISDEDWQHWAAWQRWALEKLEQLEADPGPNIGSGDSTSDVAP